MTIRYSIGQAHHALDKNQLLRLLAGYGHVEGGPVQKTADLEVTAPTPWTVYLNGSEVNVDSNNNSVTLSPADESLDRWDLIVVNDQGVVEVIEGQTDALVGTRGLSARNPSPPAVMSDNVVVIAAVYRRSNEVTIDENLLFDRRFDSSIVIDDAVFENLAAGSFDASNLSLSGDVTSDGNVVYNYSEQRIGNDRVTNESLVDDSVTVAGNSVPLGGSTPVSGRDLSDTTDIGYLVDDEVITGQWSTDDDVYHVFGPTAIDPMGVRLDTTTDPDILHFVRNPLTAPETLFQIPTVGSRARLFKSLKLKNDFDNEPDTVFIVSAPTVDGKAKIIHRADDGTDISTFEYDAANDQVELIDLPATDGTVFGFDVGVALPYFPNGIELRDDATDDQGNIVYDHSAQYVPQAILENDSVTVTAGTGLENGGSVALGGSVTVDASEPFAYDPGMTAWETGLGNEEVNRLQLQAGETLVIERIEFQQKGGGSTTSASVDVYDLDTATEIGEANLGSVTKDPGSTSTGATVLIRISNSTGGEIEAAPRVNAYIEGA